MERSIGTLKSALVKGISGLDHEMETWDTKLPMMIVAINSRPIKQGGLSAFEIVHGRLSFGNAKWVVENGSNEHIEQWHELLDQSEAITEKMAQDRIDEARKRNEKLNDNRLKENRLKVESLAVGTQIMLRTYTTKKFGAPRFTGPYTVHEVNNGIYRLKDPETDRCIRRKATREMMRVIEILPSQEYDVESIIGYKTVKVGNTNVEQFRIKWVGYKTPTWEPRESLSDEMADEYKALVDTHKNKKYVWNV